MTENTKKPSMYLPSSFWDSDGNVEASNTIISKVPGSKLVAADALTENGWLRILGIECNEDVREQLVEQMSRTMDWKVSRPTTYIIPNALQPVEPKPPAWMGDHDEILSRLETEKVGSDEFEKAILIAEITDFADDKIESLLSSLGQFISDHRFATDEDDIVLLACAIRKYSLNMPPEALEEYVGWLSLGEVNSIHNRIELELVKGILWRLSYERFPSNGDYPKTIETLQEISAGYLNRRLIFQESNVSVAAMAVAALFVLLTISGDLDSIPQLWQKVKNLKRDWVAELVEDDFAEAVDAISEFDSQLSKRLSVSFENAKATLL